MPDARLSKGDKREAAREQVRLAREKQQRRERLLRWLIPSGVTVVVVAIVVIIVLVVSNSAPAPQTTAGPKNMITDGILFTGVDGATAATTTAGLKPRELPSPASTPDDAIQIISYIDWSCPACKAFETTNASWIQDQVASGKATLEVHPIAILNRLYQGSQYSQRANNAAACVANFDPNSFLAVQDAMYAAQPDETSAGLTNSKIISVIHHAGLTDSKVDNCVTGLTFDSWVTAATARFTSNGSFVNPATGNQGTPTVLVNGHFYTGLLDDLSEFKKFVESSAG
ncbi:MAG TPA: thioredoxin domain-containing protein [Pseudolysinimonas sp.]|jgi:protein-disulfide isomerase